MSPADVPHADRVRVVTRGPTAPNSLRALLSAYTSLRASGRAFAVASVVGVAGSAFRREGARMLVVPEPDGRPATGRPATVGALSGGCLEAEVAACAAEAVRTGRAETLAFTSHLGDADRAAFGLGCGGTVRVLVQPVFPGDVCGPLDALADAVAARRPGVLAVVTDGAGVGQHRFVCGDGTSGGTLAASDVLGAAVRSVAASGAGRAVRAGDAEVRLDAAEPAVRLVAFGTGPDARALVRQGALLGWSTAAVGVSSGPEVAAAVPEADDALADDSEAVRGLDARTAAVVMTHGFARDRALVAALAESGAGYVGLLGSRHRTERLLDGLALAPGRLHAPVGLDVGAETPEEIALAACAEILACLRGRRVA